MADNVVLKPVKKPKAVLMDVSGTLTQGTFISALLAPYFQKNHKAYLEENIDQPKMHDVIDKLRTSAERDAGAPKIAANEADKVELIKSVATYVDHCLSSKKENKPLVLFRFLLWFDGYDRDILSTPVYQDVATQVKKWRLTLGLKLYVLSNGWNMATQKFLEKTTQGNLSSLVHDFMDTDLGPLTSPETFQKVIAIVKESPEQIIFLTKSADEARAARMAGINVLLVLTHQKDVEAAQSSQNEFEHVRTFNEIDFV